MKVQWIILMAAVFSLPVVAQNDTIIRPHTDTVYRSVTDTVSRVQLIQDSVAKQREVDGLS